MNAVEFILAGMLAAATPFLLAALGELVGSAEAAGVLSWLDMAPTRVPA